MNKILFLTDQVRNIKSGPGVFSQHLKILEKNFSVKIDFFSLEISPLGSIISGFNFSKLSGLISSMVYSLYYTIQAMQSKYDIVLVNSSYHILFAFCLKKSILFVNDIKWTRKPKLEFLLHKRSFRSAKLLVANSSFVADKLMRMFPNKKIMLIEKCVDMVVANARLRIADRKSLVVKSDPINIIFAKNDWRVGGLEGILETLGSFKKKNFFFTIAGISSNDMKQVNKLAREYLSDNLFEVNGVMDRTSLMDCYIENDIFLSNCDIEAFGLGAIEAASLGCLVISPNFGNGLVENMREHDFGKILESLQDLENYLKSESYVDDKDKNIKLSLEIYEAFSPQRMEQQLLKLIGLDQ